MPTVNALEIKEKMISILNQKGPSLPVHIAKETDLSILFASAFLSELIADKRLKVSSMKVGNSPLYLIPGHESMLENFSDYLKGKEKEAFNLIKEKKFLKDSEMEPAIRVAIREIKDFAIQFKMEGEIYWRYLTENESDFISARFKESETPKVFHKIQVVEKQPAVVEKAKEEKKKILEMELPGKKEIKNLKPKVKKTISKKKTAKQNEKFLEMVKEFLLKSAIEIISIEGFKKDELILRVKVGDEEQLLAAYNKKKISENEIIKAGKKASEQNLKYSVLSLGELPKKISELIEALKNIKEIEKIE